MMALGFSLGVIYVVVGILLLAICADRYGSRLASALGDLLLLQMLALAVWPLTILVDFVLLQLRPHNRRSA